MLQKWLIDLVITFVLRQLAKFGKSTDWAKVKADVKVRVEALVPGAWFDDEAVLVAMTVIDAAALVLQSTAELDRILKLLADEKWDEALAAVKALLLKAWPPVKLVALLST